MTVLASAIPDMLQTQGKYCLILHSKPCDMCSSPHACTGLSSIHWRESWKYGVRAYRYCQHDAGHALAAASFAAAGLGWQARLLDQVGTEDVGRLTGVWPDSHSSSKAGE
jgi:hypothetical protein